MIMLDKLFPLWMQSLLFFGLISALTIGFGYFTSRNCPNEVRKLIRQKFGFYAAIPFLIGVVFSQMFMSSSSRIDISDKLKPENLTSIEKIADFEKEQSKQIQLLKVEVESLREDLRSLKDYLFLASMIVLFCTLQFCFSGIPSINEKILDEKRKEKMLNL